MRRRVVDRIGSRVSKEGVGEVRSKVSNWVGEGR